LSLALGSPGSPIFVSAWWLGFTAFVGCVPVADELGQNPGLDRAAEKGLTAPATPRRDACAGLERWSGRTERQHVRWTASSSRI
jgi:hypothetical protein